MAIKLEDRKICTGSPGTPYPDQKLSDTNAAARSVCGSYRRLVLFINDMCGISVELLALSQEKDIKLVYRGVLWRVFVAWRRGRPS